MKFDSRLRHSKSLLFVSQVVSHSVFTVSTLLPVHTLSLNKCCHSFCTVLSLLLLPRLHFVISILCSYAKLPIVDPIRIFPSLSRKLC